MKSRRRAVVASTLLMMIVLSIAPRAGATEADGSTTTQAESADDNAAPLTAAQGSTTDETVQITVRALVGIASVTTVAAVVFFWHTSPRRRLRIAGQRMNDRTG